LLDSYNWYFFLVRIQKKYPDHGISKPINIFYDEQMVDKYVSDIIVNELIILELG